MATETIIAKYDLDLKEIKVKIAELEGGYQKLETKGKKAFDDVSASANKTGKEISNSDKLVSGLAQRLIAAFAIERVIAFGAASVRAFQDAEVNAKKLEVAVKNIGKEGDIAFKKLIAQSAKLQSISIFSDDDIQKAQAQLVQFGLNSQQVEKLIPQILDLASATGDDLGTATDRVIQGINGLTRGLRPLGIDFKDTGDKAQNLAIITENLGKFAGQTGEILETSAGTVARLGNAFDDLKERVGGFIVRAANLIKLPEFFDAILFRLKSTDELIEEGLSKGIDDSVKKFEDSIEAQRKAQGATFNLKKAVDEYVLAKNKEIIALGEEIKMDSTPQKIRRIKFLERERDAIKELTKATNTLGLTENEKAKRADAAANAAKKLAEEEAKAVQKQRDDAKKFTDELATMRGERKAEDDIARAKRVEDEKKALILTGKNAQEIADIIFAQNQSKREREAEEEKKLNQLKIDSALEAAQTIADAAFEIESNQIQKDQERALEDLAIQETQESQALDNKEEKELSRKNLTETQKKLIQDKYDKLRAETQKKFDQKELEVKKKAFEDNKSLSIKQAILNGALAITKILADVPKFDFGVATAILVGLAVAQTSAQIAVINAQKFAKGTDFVQRGNSPKGIDTIPAYVNEGEAIIPTDKNKKYHDYTKHMISGTLEDYINQNNVMPALQSYVAKSKEIERKSTAQAMADSIVLNNQINEYAMTRAVSKGGEGRSVNIANHKALAKSLANEMNKNNNFF